MNEKKDLKFIPFHAINEFMRNDFRLHVIRSALSALPSLNNDFSVKIDKLTRKYVTVPGFRNSAKAPLTVKTVAMVKAFEKEPGIAAAVLNIWSKSKPELEVQIYEMLTNRGWKVLPIEADRTKLPGFLTQWPEGEDYETLFQSFQTIYPISNTSIDETSLMVIWLSSRLPIDKIDIQDISNLPETII